MSNWKLDIFSCILVLRNHKWFDNSIKQIEDIWNKILYERINGYQHRAPTKRERKPSIVDEPLNATGCLIHDSSDDEPSNDNNNQSKNTQDLNVILDISLDKNILENSNKKLEENKNKVDVEQTVNKNEEKFIFKIDTTNV